MPNRSTEQDVTALRDLLAARGPLKSIQAVSAEILTAYEGRLPHILLDLWEDHGVGDLLDGRIKLCVPTELAGAVEGLFRDDPDFGIPPPVQPDDSTPQAIDIHAIAHGPFGDLILWSERHGLVLVNTQLGLVEAPFLFRPETAPPPNAAILLLVLGADPAFLDLADAAGTVMFDRAMELHKPLVRMRIYAPGLAQGGAATPPSVETLILAPYREWLEDRVVSKVWRLSDVAAARPDIRRIGRAL